MLTRRLIPLFALLSTCVAALAIPACGSGTEREDFDTPDGSSGSAADGSIIPVQDSGPTISSGGSSGGGPRTGPAEVFVHTSDTLYKLDPISKAVTKVGALSGVEGSLVDIALDENGAMFGTTYEALYSIDKTNGKATLIKKGPTGDRTYPDSLSFAPKGTIENDREVLVGYVGADYVRIDPSTGAVMKVTANALGDDLISSGDLVSIKDGDFLTYLTVKPNPDCSGNSCNRCETNDCMVQIDPKKGDIIADLGSVLRPQVFGLAFWAGTLYGINTAGKLFEITPGDPNHVTNITIPGNLGAGLKFYGAGSTTSAPAGPN